MSIVRQRRLDLAYIASGRLDAYIEGHQPLDIAAGLILVENAGGRSNCGQSDMPDKFGIVASNGLLDLRP